MFSGTANKNILLTIINTYWSKDNIDELALAKHLTKFVPFDNCEVIITIDECDQKTLRKFNNYLRFGFKIIPITGKRAKVGGSRNIGLEHATGKYVMFIDSFNDSVDSGENFTLSNLVDNLNAFLKCISGTVPSDVPRESSVTTSGTTLEESLGKASSDVSKTFEPDIIELSNRYNKYYRANVWNNYYRREFLVKHKVEFIQWQGYEDFMFNFLLYKLGATIVIFNEGPCANTSVNTFEDSSEKLCGDTSNTFEDSSEKLCGDTSNTSELLIYPEMIRVPCKVDHKICYAHVTENTKYDYGIHTVSKYLDGCNYFKKYLGYVPIEYSYEQLAMNRNSSLAKIIGQVNVTNKQFFKYLFLNIERMLDECADT